MSNEMGTSISLATTSLTRCDLPLFSHSLVISRFALDVRAVQRQKIRAGTEERIGKKKGAARRKGRNSPATKLSKETNLQFLSLNDRDDVVTGHESARRM